MTNRRYIERMLESLLPRLTNNERIYLKVPYMKRNFAKVCHCGFDREKKLWFTGAFNSWLNALVECYDVDEEHTSDDAKQLLQMALETNNRDELLSKIIGWYEERGITTDREATKRLD